MNADTKLVFQKHNIGLGKRKEAVARVFLVPGGGKIVINKVPGEKYLQYNAFCTVSAFTLTIIYCT